MKKVVSFIIAAVLLVSVCSTGFAIFGDPMADANAKFAALTQNEKDKLYDLTDAAAINIVALLKGYAETGIISSTTYERLSDNIMNHIAEAKEDSRLPALMPPME